RSEALQEIAATGDTEQLPPGAPIGMAIGAEIAPSHPALVRTVRIGTEMGRGVDLAAAPPRGHDVRWRGCGWLWVRGTAVLTGVAWSFLVVVRKGCGLTVSFWPWALGRWGYGPVRSVIAVPL